jgi:hypothetical protein
MLGICTCQHREILPWFQCTNENCIPGSYEYEVGHSYAVTVTVEAGTMRVRFGADEDMAADDCMALFAGDV